MVHETARETRSVPSDTERRLTKTPLHPGPGPELSLGRPKQARCPQTGHARARAPCGGRQHLAREHLAGVCSVIDLGTPQPVEIGDQGLEGAFAAWTPATDANLGCHSCDWVRQGARPVL